MSRVPIALGLSLDAVIFFAHDGRPKHKRDIMNQRSGVEGNEVKVQSVEERPHLQMPLHLRIPALPDSMHGVVDTAALHHCVQWISEPLAWVAFKGYTCMFIFMCV